MEVLFVLIPVSIVLAAASVVACLFAIRGGQFDDLESPPWRILFEDRKAAGESLAPLAHGVATGNATGRKSVMNGLSVTNEEETDPSLSAHARRSAPL